jgi:hypothetical protein
MSNYRSFLKDFPVRAFEVLNVIDVNDSRKFTRLLTLAASIFVMPYERLNAKKNARNGYLVAHQDHEGPGNDFENFLEKRVGDDSDFGFQNFLYKRGDYGSDPQIGEGDKVDPTESLKDYFDTIRHGLAHGNLLIKEKNGSIDRIVFVAGGRRDAKYLSMSYADLDKFLRAWLKFLKDIELPDNIQYSEASDGTA